MNVEHYDLHLTCPRDGALLEPVNEGKPTDAGHSLRAVACCSKCRYEFLISIEIMQVTERAANGQPPRQGTDASYNWRRRRGLPTLPDDAAAHNVANRKRKVVT